MTSAKRPPGRRGYRRGRGVPVSGSSVNGWITVDITDLVADWIDLPSGNFGIALVSTGAFASFDSKENVSTSHEPRVQIVLSGMNFMEAWRGARNRPAG